MFVADRHRVLDAIKFMGAKCCSYGKGDRWPEGRCDCKYGLGERGWPTASEQGNGCPELASLYSIISALTDEEWDVLVQRGGHAPSGLRWSSELGPVFDGLRALDHAISTARERLDHLGLTR